jgi:hypothetical protein
MHGLPTLGFLTIVLSLLGPACGSCRAPFDKNEVVEEALCLERNSPAILNNFINKHCKASPNTPVIQAFYAQQSFPQELSIADLLAAEASLNICAPGPFLFNNDNEINAQSKLWRLSAMPTYFILQLNNKDGDENFYIANQSGFPINCQSFRLSQQDYTVLVLVPQTVLESDKFYYLYLVQTQGSSRQLWIQPLSLAQLSN